jgi:hypothetical protein
VDFKPKHWQNGYDHPKKLYTENPNYGAIGDRDKIFLEKYSNVKKICEIGTGTGKSTKALSKYGAEVHTIDMYDHLAKLPKNTNFYFMHSHHFWKTHSVSGFNLYFIDAGIKLVDAEEIFKRATNNFKIIFHDYYLKDKGVHNHKLMVKYLFDKCHITETLGGKICSLLECEKL